MQDALEKDSTYILLIEDDRDDFFLTQDLLQRVESRQYRLVWSASCDSAIQELRERRFDAVLVDYRIGERTGLDFIKEFGPVYPNTPMILLTGLRNTEIDLAAQAAGAADYLVKDSLTEELLDRSIRYACQQVARSALLDSVLSNAAAGMVALNATGEPILWNRQALRALDIDAKGLTGVRDTDVASALTRIGQRGALPEEFRNKESHSFEVTANAVPGAGKIIVFHDVTRRARAEQLLRQAVTDAEAASQAKSSFLATMSHELRTPLNGILGMVRVLESTEIDDSQREYLSTIKSSGDNLLGLINDVLDLSKIEAGSMSLESIDIDLPTIVDDVVKMLAPIANARGIEIGCIVDPRMKRTIHGDPLRLKQILMNLGSNAVKFTSEGSVVIAVTVDQAAQGREAIRFSVSDSGIGIPSDKLQQLFKKFTQVDASTTRKYGGTGLGLAICRELVTLMQGRIWCESTDGQGSTFSFVIPVTGESLLHPSIPLELQSIAQAHLLLVTQSTSLSNLFGGYIKSIRGRLDVVTDTAGATALLANATYAAIILDNRTQSVEPAVLSHHISQNGGVIPIFLRLQAASISPSPIIPGFDDVLPLPFVSSTFVRLGEALRKHVRKLNPRANMAAQPVAQRGLSILMAEDNEPNQRVARALLRSAGFSIEIASDGAKAVAMATETRYDVILMDLHMPVMDGLSATRALRQLDNARNVPIIGLTASVSREDRDLCLQAGMNEHMAKPVDWDVLIATLTKLEKQIYGTALAG
jgi:signal transduction histidine kinase